MITVMTMTATNQKLKSALSWGHMQAASQLLQVSWQMFSDAVDEIYAAGDPTHQFDQVSDLMIDVYNLADGIKKKTKKLRNSLDPDNPESAE